MYLTSQEINNLNKFALIEFLGKKVIEGHHIDYKVALSGEGKRGQRKNFLKDVTAFANASGGNIFIGVKEPEDELSIEDQIVGIENGESICKDLERVVRDSIQPRIPGFQIRPIDVLENRVVIVAHVPPSTVRPHMVYYDHHQYFYIRHQESSDPMTIDEIRETFLSSLSAEARAKKYLEQQEVEVRAYDISDEFSILLLQGIPLFPLESHWDVFSEEFGDLVEGLKRSGRFRDGYDLRTFNRPKPNILGIEGIDNGRHKTQIHRNGYISTTFFMPIEFYTPHRQDKAAVLSSLHKSLFMAFNEICFDAIQITGNDLPFVLRCKLLNADSVLLDTESQLLGTKYTDKYPKQEITWPDQVRLPGEDFSLIVSEWVERMYNAFGRRGPSA